MDTAKAKALEARLKGKAVGRWTIESLIDHGKSAAVFKASNATSLAAVKVFDDDLIERFGGETQLARIERELDLIGKGHANMVKILDGGVDPVTNSHFLVMEYLSGSNLKKRLTEVPVEAIGAYVRDIAACAEHLEALDLVHRDIKPENILVSDDMSRVTLLDFGVVKPIFEPGVTDLEGLRPFIGTLQYSSPEFLHRKEEQTPEGWRALTYYQIGGVLHDLIMREALFGDHAEPFARLVNAVQHVVPTIQSDSVPSYLVDLAKVCLLKRPEDRLRLLTWDSFKPPATGAHGLSGVKERVTRRVLAGHAEVAMQSGAKPDFAAPLLEEIVTFLKAAVRRVGSGNVQFPAFSTITRQPAKSPSVKVTYNRSEAHLITSDFSVVLTVEIVDAEARAMTVDACVHMSGAPQPCFSAARCSSPGSTTSPASTRRRRRCCTTSSTASSVVPPHRPPGCRWMRETSSYEHVVEDHRRP